MAFTDKDNRQERSRIAQRKMTFTTLVSETSKTITQSINGEILSYTIVAPNLTTDTVFDFKVLNDDDVPIYVNSGIADTVTTATLIYTVPMGGTTKFEISFTTAQIAEFTLYLYYR